MRPFVAFSLVVFALFGCGSQSAQEIVPPNRIDTAIKAGAWPFAATLLPAPPFQGKPRDGIEHSGLPQGFVRAMERLFAQGFADPRNLPYHEAEITLTTNPERPRQIVSVKVFVLPNKMQNKSFGIAWNGLVYPLESVGAMASLSADIQALLQHDRELCARLGDIVGDSSCLRLRSPRAEIHSLQLEEVLPSHFALLWARGEFEFAKALWQVWIRGGTPEDTPEVSLAEREIYGRLASHFRYVIEDRAFWAHVRGDDQLALANLQALIHIKNDLSKSAKTLNLPDETWSSPESVDSLLSDQELRARRKGQSPSRLPEKLPADPSERIRLLVDLLNEVNEPVFARYGQEKLVLEDKILHALVLEGLPAVVPLANAMETDSRMTRSVWYQPHGIKLFSVADVAEIALIEITKGLPMSAAPGDMSRKERAERFRAAVSK